MAQTLRDKIRRRMAARNQIYIIPTRSGLVFLVCVIVLVLVGATYNNNLIFALAFLLSSLFIISMIQTHFNLMGVSLEALACEEAFAGDSLTMHFHLRQRRAGLKTQLRVRSLSRQWRTLLEGREHLMPHDLSKPASLVVEAWRRGVHPLPAVSVETRYPLGLFRAWKVYYFPGQLVVYPKPEGAAELEPTLSSQGNAELGLRANSEGDFGELKAYRAGESYHQIAWKHYARSGVLYSKVHWGEDNRHYNIPWPANSMDREASLRQMSQWIKQACEENATFEMELPSGKIEAGSGFDQAKLCWRALAAIGEAA